MKLFQCFKITNLIENDTSEDLLPDRDLHTSRSESRAIALAMLVMLVYGSFSYVLLPGTWFTPDVNYYICEFRITLT